MSEEEKAKFKLEAERLALEEVKLGIDSEKIHIEDRSSARQREIAVKDKTPAILASVSFIGFFGILGLMMFVEVPANAKDPLLIMLGALGAIVTGITQYYFGSSSGSAKKNDILARIIKK
jgi:1,4-dihydroxy-2-naphthoate octaprenyltransferase